MKPLIGLTSYREQARWGVWDQPADLLPVMYADAIVRAGGVPVVLPPATDDPDAAAAVVGRLDGLVVSGGADVDPASYGEEPHERTVMWRPDRDAWELALLTSAAAQNLPTLGVCRGMQVMAVATGGTLDQHTPDQVGHEEHSPGADAFGDIDVTVVEDSQAAHHPRTSRHRALPPPPVGALASRLRRDRPRRRRVARGDGGRRNPLLPRESSGTPRPAATSGSSTPWSAPPSRPTERTATPGG